MPRQATLAPVFDPTKGRYYISIPPAMSETGKRQRLFFDSERQARAEADRRKRNVKRHGTVAAQLPADLATETARCAEMLKPWGATLTEAVSFFVRHRTAQARSKSVAEVWSAFQSEKDAHSDRYQRTLRYYASKIPAKVSGALICDIDRATLKASIQELSTQPTTFNDFKRIWHAVFEFAIREGWASDNPAKLIENLRKESKPPCILTVEQAAKLLRATEPCETAAIALLIFTGVRPDELTRLDWSDVNLSSRNLRIPDAKAKTITGRNIHLEDAALDWLKRCSDRTGPVIPANWKRRLSRIRKAAGLTGDDQDICRHSYGTYWLAANGDDTATLQSYMGHTHLATYLRHYHRAVDKRTALAFWKLSPDFVLRSQIETKSDSVAA